MPLYQLFPKVNQQVSIPQSFKCAKSGPKLSGSSRKDARTLAKFCRLLGELSVSDWGLLLYTAQQTNGDSANNIRDGKAYRAAASSFRVVII